MGRGKKKNLNPADQQRRKQKQRQKLKDKEDKQFIRKAYQSNDPEAIMKELKSIASVSTPITIFSPSSSSSYLLFFTG